MTQITQLWNHSEPSEEDQQQDLQLLTIGGISVLGRWSGNFGEFYVGWSHYKCTTELYHPKQERMQYENRTN